MRALRVAALALVLGSTRALEKLETGIELPSDTENSRELAEAGSGSGPPPPPLPPATPPANPGTATQIRYSTVAKLSAAGDVSSYESNQSLTTAITEKFANLTSVAVDNVELLVTSASVLLTVTITLPLGSTSTQATALQNTVSSTLSDAAAANSFLDNLVDVLEIISVISEESVVYLAPPPSSSDDGLDGGAIAGIVIGSLVVAAIFVGGAFVAMKGMGGGDGSSGVMFTSVGSSKQENV